MRVMKGLMTLGALVGYALFTVAVDRVSTRSARDWESWTRKWRGQ